MSNPVGVTMFFSLKSLSDSLVQTRPNEFYQKNATTTLSVNIPLVIFCDESTRKWIEPLRSSLSSAKTYYVEKNFTETEFYKVNHPIVVRNRQVSPGYKDPTDRNTPSYLLIQMFKVFALQIASELVDASHYIWIDMGCGHIISEASKYLQTVFENLRPKVGITYIHYRSHQELDDMKSFLATGGPCGVACTMYTVEKQYITLLYTRALSIFYEMLSKGVGHCDEQVFTYLYDRFPDMFTLTYGDYYSIASNYNNVISDYWAIRWHFIQNALNAGRKDLATNCAKKLIESHTIGSISIDSNELNFLQSLL